MRYAFGALLPFSVILLGATCVTNVNQHGDRGPWTGEVVNSGPQTVFGVAATARLLDAAGRELYPGRVGVLACPSKLLPGEVGAFELFESSPDYPPVPSLPLSEAKLPLQAAFDDLAHENVGTGQARGDGLLVTLLSRDAARKEATVKLTNNSNAPYYQFTVCGILRDKDRRIIAVGRADGPLPSTLAEGQSVELRLAFDAWSDGPIRFHALGLWQAPYTDCCPLGASSWHSVNTGPFSVLLPPGWDYLPAQGVDSYVGSFVGDDVTLRFDYGLYGAAPSFDDPQLSVHEETIGGYTARLFSPRAGGGASGIWLDVANASEPLGLPITLLLNGEALTPEQQQVALQIFRSVRINR